MNTEDNEIRKMLLEFNNEDLANKMFETIYIYMLFHFGEDNITLHNLFCIMPNKLCKIMNKDELLYEPMVTSIMMYKVKNGIETGFRATQYEKALETYLTYATNKKHVGKIKRKEHQATIEDFKEEKSATITDVVCNLVSSKDVELVDINNMYAREHANERNGKLVAKIPYRKNYVDDASIYWICECDCGQFVSYRAASLKNHTSCKMCENMKSHIGEKHGSLECIDQKITIKDNGKAKVELKVKCECGSIRIMTVGKFLSAKCCGHYCPMFSEKYHDMEKSSTNFKNLFRNGTNVAKLGNTKTNRNNTTGYLGVYYQSKLDKYMAYITFRGKTENLGFYNLPEVAYKVRLSAQKIAHEQCIEELEKDEFIQNNKYLKRLLEKVKKKVDECND
ncbi:hypothetical protein [uncultured Clostridium sp.]|uniref:hypothetical protein n=1 Tax=uncultured Clostridium sp. TaxID=59620 RepID=UPI0026EE52D2|nr:hypothetical protein [uncultured Clostridium sp.]